jgi:hypothetical protein
VQYGFAGFPDGSVTTLHACAKHEAALLDDLTELVDSFEPVEGYVLDERLDPDAVDRLIEAVDWDGMCHCPNPVVVGSDSPDPYCDRRTGDFELATGGVVYGTKVLEPGATCVLTVEPIRIEPSPDSKLSPEEVHAAILDIISDVCGGKR